MSSEIYLTLIEGGNWEAYEELKVPLVLGINAFIGTSNSGKSSILRLIEWVLCNRPAGTEYIRLGQDECWGAVTLSNGYRVKRRRSSSGAVNEYELFKDGQPVHNEPLTGFGTGVPAEVVNAVGMGGLEHNFSKQLAAPFLISESPSARAKTIGNLEELGKIDEALSSTNDDIRLDNRTATGLEKEVKALEKTADRLRREIAKEAPRVEALQALRHSIAQKQTALATVEKAARRLAEIDAQLTQLNQEVARAERLLRAWPEDLPARVELVTKLTGWVQRLAAIETEISGISFMSQEELHRLEELVAAVDQKVAAHRQVSVAATRLRDIEVERERLRTSFSRRVAELDCHAIDLKIEAYRSLNRHVTRLQQITEEITRTQQQVAKSQVQIDALLDEFVGAMHQAAVCPTCMQDTRGVTHDHAKQLI